MYLNISVSMTTNVCGQDYIFINIVKARHKMIATRHLIANHFNSVSISLCTATKTHLLIT